MSTVIHLRCETKPLERRSPLSPTSAKELIQAGYLVKVERSSERIYKDDEYTAVGAQLVDAGLWENAPKEHIILGLKELPTNGKPLSHPFIHFQHCFKKQDGWANALSRFSNGGATLYDLEFLTDDSGRRIAAFGYWAGYAGAAIALLSWTHQLDSPNTEQGAVPVFETAPDLTKYAKSKLQPVLPKNGGQFPRIIIIGALGRCGKGAINFCLDAGIPEKSILHWDLEETAKGGPFIEVAESDIFINCVYLGAHEIPPFVTFKSLKETSNRRLRVICDVSCDPNSANNPVPVYSGYSSFTSPTVSSSPQKLDPELRIVAIDHLPTLVARESSDEYSALLLPSLLNLNRRHQDGVWTRAEKVYKDRVHQLPL